ncbi:Solute carrier family 22 member 8 [Heterocephalus glaber]|uniref:Solute carrier family 22 member 8 n=1 Tax=Heterocephalus glaber TaxID=10181 RepID=G5AYK0_HETGA|nr:Solute carrier family 22 member 8 [Heterocephalus glaber]
MSPTTWAAPGPCYPMHRQLQTHLLLHTPVQLGTASVSTCEFGHHPEPTSSHAHMPLFSARSSLQLQLLLPRAMTFSDLLERVGSMGPFQYLHIVLLSLPILGMANHNLLQIFLATTPAHHCRPPPNASTGPWVPLLGPSGKPEKCLRLVHTPNASMPNTTQVATEPCLDGWVYNTSRDTIVTEPDSREGPGATLTAFLAANLTASLYKSYSPKHGARSGAFDNGTMMMKWPPWPECHCCPTIVCNSKRQWDLVCDSAKMKEMAQSVFMAGILIGGLVLGELSDRFGRKPILTLSYLLLATSGSSAAFSPSLPVYMVFRFLCGMSISGISLSTVILNVEWMPTRIRAISSTAIGYFYTCGQFLLSGLAYAIPQWRWLQLTVSVPFFIFSLLSWWIPESIRWMVLSGKFTKALQTLQRVAAFNGKKEEGEKLSMEDLKFSLQKDIALAKLKYGILDLFRVPILRRVTLCLSLAWFSTGFAYYSLAMGVEEFGVDIYILQVIFGGVDIPAKLITILALSYLGRHVTLASVLILAGGAILGLIFTPEDMHILKTSLAVFGKGCLSGSFSCIFLYTSELYPTVIRQTGMGISNMWTRVGSMIAPLVKITGEVQPFIPNIIYGTMALLGGSAAFFLPETLNRPLPENIEDLQQWYKPAKDTKLELEAEKEAQKIPLKSSSPGLGPS